MTEEINEKLKEFDKFEIGNLPEMLKKDIMSLREGIVNNVSYIDCLQDEVRGSAHGVTGDENHGCISEEYAEEIISFFCRRRW